MPINYLCIDDESAADVGPLLASVVAKGDNLSIKREQPQELKKQLDDITKATIDGLILDLRLDQYKGEEGYKAPYQGVTLAQELRTRMAEGRIRAFPIVLWSVDSKFKEAYERDATSHDLFDRVYVKDTEFTNEPERVARELKSLSEGYKIIAELRSQKKDHFAKILGIDSVSLDPRIGEQFVSGFKYPVHEYGRYILRELIDAQGPLIDESVLSARLGVDIENSEDWEICKNRLASCAYKGVFSGAWPRWWAVKIEEWWQKRGNSPSSLRRITARERVAFLKKTLRVNKLVAATPIEAGYSEMFWAICKGSGAALDPIDALRISRPELKAWQDTPVISIKDALERTGRDRGIVIHPLERPRLAAIKAAHKLQETHN